MIAGSSLLNLYGNAFIHGKAQGWKYLVQLLIMGEPKRNRLYVVQALPEDWLCPICSADKNKFQAKAKEVAGFAENQKYGLGTNSLTGGQKSLLIFGSFFAFFFLFLAGYFIQ